MENSLVDLETCCKTCFNSDDVELVELDEQFTDYQATTWDILQLFCPGILQKDEAETQPNKMCLDCFKKLEVAYDFHVQVSQVDNQLRTLLNSSDEAPLEVVVSDEEEIIENNEEEVEVVENLVESDCAFINEDDFKIESNNDSEDELLTKLYSTFQKPKDYTAPEGTRIVYIKNFKHFQCLSCNFVIDRREKVTNHVRNCDSVMVDERDLPQIRMEKVFKGPTQQRVPKKPKDKTSFRCDKCDRTFANGNTYKNHMKRHEGLLPYQCPCCSLAFPYKLVLERHMRAHTGEKKFECDIERCGKKFATKAGMESHRRLHFGDLPFPCEDCGKKFNSKSNLKIHTRTHTGEKPYKCKTCDKRYAGSNDLAKHMKKHFGDFMYSCEICKEKFRTQGDVRRHAVVHIVFEEYEGVEIEVAEEEEN